MQIMVMNPAFPKDKTKAKALSAEQFAVVHDYIVQCMNDRKKIKESAILQMLADAGKPVIFETQS